MKGIKRFIQTLTNIFKIEDLRNRIFYTLLLVLVYRIGSFIVLPGINPLQLKDFSEKSGEGLVGLLNLFSGGAFGNASIFALGIMPYISASIVIQLLTILVPYLQRMQREGESGRRKINQYTRYLTIAILAFQAPAYLTNLHAQVAPEAFMVKGVMYQITSAIILMAGTMFVMWLGERITDRGLGNGISLIIMVGIIARLPMGLTAELGVRFNETTGGMLYFLVEIIVLFFVFVASIALVQASRRIPVQYAKRIVGNKQYGGVRQYIPLKLNAAGVMPIIFAQALMFIPMLFAGFGESKFATIFRPHGFWYTVVFGLMVIIFTWFYTAITVNPTLMAEEMKKNGGFIPGVKPGKKMAEEMKINVGFIPVFKNVKKTAEYIDTVMSRITFPGSLFLAVIAILPTFAALAGINDHFSQFFGGTSLLILVGVILDTLQQIESHLLMRHYDGLMKTGRLKGRTN